MSRNIRSLTFVSAALAAALALLPALSRAQGAPAPAGSASPAPPAPAGSPSATPPSQAPSKPPSDADDEETIEAEPSPSSTAAPASPPTGAAGPSAPSLAPTPAPAPAPPVAAKPAAAPSAAASPEPKKAPESGPTSDEANETDSILKSAGYELTPGVSALPVSPDFVFSGYIQGQYESHEDSTDQLRQGGALLNQDRFVLRRGRFKISHDWEWAQVILEIDGNTVRGPAMRLQKAEASLIYGRSKDKDQPPIAQLTFGQFDLPFGFEIPYVPKVRWFMERSQASRALFPGEPDIGARLSGGIGFARYAISITNGEPLDEKTTWALQDPNANKDITARFGAVAKPLRSLALAGGVSYNRGKGFSPGTDATKPSLQWQDKTNPSAVDPSNELQGLPASAATLSKTFERWAVGADLEVLFRSALGWSMLYGELVMASNLDRGLFIADPTLTSYDVREFGYYIGFTQEITPYGVIGFRYDSYDPNADNTDQRRGKILPVSQTIKTYSPLVGLVLPGRARLLFQYDVIRDFLARDERGVPTDFGNNQWTLRLQVNL